MTVVKLYTKTPVKREVWTSAFDSMAGRYIDQCEEKEDREHVFDSVSDALLFGALHREVLSRLEVYLETTGGCLAPLVVMESDALERMKWTTLSPCAP